MGGGFSKSKSSGSTSSQENVWDTQGDALENLYSSLQDLYSQSMGGMPALNQLAQSLNPYMRQAMDMSAGGAHNLLGGGAIGDTSEIRNELMDSIRRTTSSPTNTSQMYQSIVGGPGNTYIDPMVEAMKTGALDNLSRMQSSAGLGAAAQGQTGSSRHAMQNAMLAKEANQDMMAQETAMRAGAYDKDLSMKMNIANLADQNVQASQDRLLSMLGQADQNVGTGMNYGPTLQNLGMGYMAPHLAMAQQPWNYMNQYVSGIGAPLVLGSSSGRQSGSSKGSGFSLRG